MAFQDRAYYRDSNRPHGNPLMWLLTGSLSLGSWFGINVRLHASLLILVVLTLLLPGAMGGPYNSFTFCTVLFASVLLHEFGHCAGSWSVGGHPSEIILSPLGGLALADAPRRPWATFITVVCGPAVNLLLCILSAAVIWVATHTSGPLPWNPLHRGLLMLIPTGSTFAYWAWWVFIVNYGLLLFNVLWPVFPLDGGQMLQSLLWVKFGYYKSMNVACTIGIAGSIVMAMLGIATTSLLLIFIAASCLITCISMRNQLKAAGPYAFEEESEDYSASLWNDPPSHHTTTKHKHLSRRALKKAQRRAHQAELEQARIDSILAKVSAQGMHSLTWRERRALHKATERQRMMETATPSRKHHW